MYSVPQRNQSMDLLRVFACIGVILIHVSASVFAQNYVEQGNLDWLFCYILNASFKWPVPIFVMITGFFFLKPEKELPIKKLYGKYILHLILTLIFWTWFYAVTLRCRYTCYYPFGGLHTNFWYIGMCIGLYISMPVLRSIASNDKLLAYSCWTWLFIRSYLFIGAFVALPIEITDYVFVGYMGYCLWGYYLSRLKLNRKKTRFVYVIGFLSLIATISLPLMTEGKVNFDFESLGTILISIAIFLFVIKHPIQLPNRLGRIVEHLSAMTLGIYMVHTFVVIEIFTRIHRFFPNVFVLVLLAFVATIVLSYIIILVIKQIPVLKKWVV